MQFNLRLFPLIEGDKSELIWVISQFFAYSMLSSNIVKPCLVDQNAQKLLKTSVLSFRWFYTSLVLEQCLYPVLLDHSAFKRPLGYLSLSSSGWDIHTSGGFSQACRCAKGLCTVLMYFWANLFWTQRRAQTALSKWGLTDICPIWLAHWLTEN